VETRRSTSCVLETSAWTGRALPPFARICSQMDLAAAELELPEDTVVELNAIGERGGA